MSMRATVITRWNDAGLNSSIAALHPGRWDMQAVGSTPETEANATLPRAECAFGPEYVYEDTVAYRIRDIPVRISVWHNDMAALETFLDTIESNMDDSDRAGTNPMTGVGGTILDFRFEGREIYPEKPKNLVFGYVEFTLKWQKALTTPS